MTKAKLSFGISKRWIAVALVVLLGVAAITAALCSRIGFAADEPSTREIDGKTFYELDSESDLLWFANECDEKIEYTMESDSSGNRTMKGIIELNAILTADIDVSSGLWNSIGFSDYVDYDEYSSVLKKVNFEGIFDGNGYTIHGMNIANTAAWGDGMFTSIGENGVVKNLHLKAFAEGEIGFGAVAYENRGVISNCLVTGELLGRGEVGGVVGHNRGLVENCTSEAVVYALNNFYTGGIAGYNFGTLKNCRNFGEVGHDAERAGGIAGYNSGPIENCYNVGSVTGVMVGGIASCNYDTITNCYFDSDVFEGEAVVISGSSSKLTNVEGKSKADFENGTVCSLLGYHSTHLFSCLNDCMICGEPCGEHNWKDGVCMDCETVCAHSEFDSTTGECKKCGLLIAIVKIEKGGETVYYKTADAFRNAMISHTDKVDLTVTLLSDIETVGFPFLNDGAKGTLNLNGHKIISNAIEMILIVAENSELTINGSGSLEAGEFAIETANKVIIGSDVSFNGTLISRNGGVFDLSNVAIPEEGINVEFSCYSGLVCQVGDTLILPDDYYFFVDGKAVYSCSGTTEGTILRHAEHSGEDVEDNWDGTHSFTCSACGQDILEEHKDYKADYTWNEPYEGECYVYLDLYCGICEGYVDSDSGYAQLVASTEAVDCLNPGSETYEITFNIGEQSYTASKTVSIKSENHVAGFENGFCTACGGYEKPEVDPGESLEWDYDDVYLISNAGQLYWFADYVNNVNNNVNGKLVSNIIVNTTLDENARPWTPIGLFNSYRSYCGDFDGNGYTISGLYFKDAEASGVGLFGSTDYNYRVKNVGIENCYFEGKDYVGGLFGYASTEISNCFVGKDVTVIGEGNVGAFAGYLSSGTVSNCFAYAQTFAGSFYSDYVYIENCYYLSETETEDGGKTAEQFANGEVAFLLQAGILEEDIYDDDGNVIDTIIPEIWGQEIGVDELPILGGKKVYSVTDCKDNQIYSNTNALVHADLNVFGYCEACQVKITGASISIGSSLTMNYQVEILDSSIIEEGYNVAMQFTMNGNTVLVYPPMYGADSLETLSSYRFSFEGIAPQNMASLIDAVLVLVDVEGNFVKALASKAGYSVKENAEKLLETYYYEDYLVQLVTDMLEYGAAAQEYRDFNTDNKANAGLEYLPSEKLPNADENVKEIITAEGIEIGDVYFASATVWFDNVNRIGVKLSTTENATLYVNGTKAELDGTVYYTGAIYATDFGRVFTFELYDGETLVQTLKYSVASYVYSMMNKTENGELTEMANLARALYRYGFSANAYRHVSERTECELGEVTGYEWSKDFSTCTAHGVCKYCDKDVSVTVNTVLGNGEFVAVFENSVAGIQKKPISALSDLRGFTNEELQSAVSLLVGNGVTNVDITVDANADMTYVSNAIKSTDKTDITLKISGVASIADSAFEDNTQISSVFLPDATTIDYGAFLNCSNLKKIDAPNIVTLGMVSFSNCTALEEINMPEVESIGGNCFYACENLKAISFKKARDASGYAFARCSSLEQVDMPELTHLTDNLFYQCEALKSVTFEKVEFVEMYVFYGCSSLETINIPNAEIVRNHAFRGTAIKEISLPYVTSIGNNAFTSCKKLETVNIPNLTEIPDCAFCSCSSLKEISFKKVQSIGEKAFYECSNLETVDIPKATSIGGTAFERCSSLIEANFPLVTEIGNGAFSRCKDLTKAYFPEAISLGVDAFYVCESLIDVYLPNAIYVGDFAFVNCGLLTEIRLDSAVELGKYALSNCYSLTTIYLPKATSIGKCCFSSCQAIKHITLSAEGEITLGVDAFAYCDTTEITLVLNKNKDSGGNSVLEWKGYFFSKIEYK